MHSKKIKFRQIKFHQQDYKKLIYYELEQGREIVALLLVHGYIEAYLRDVLLLEIKSKDLENVTENIDNAKFPSLLLANFFNNNITIEEFSDLEELNDFRNKFAHRLIDIEAEDKDTKEEIAKQVKKCIIICDKVKEIRNRIINKKAEEAIKEVNSLKKIGTAFIGVNPEEPKPFYRATDSIP